MEDLSQKSIAELAEMTRNAGDDDKTLLRAIADQVGAKYSGNTGVAKLKESILAEMVLDEKPDASAPLDAASEIVTDDDDEDPDPKLDESDPIVQALRAKQATPKEAEAMAEEMSILDMPRTLQAMLNPRKPGLSEVEKRAIVRAKGMRLHRVRVSNLDPGDAALNGAIITVYNKYLGKVSKYVPFGEENDTGYHLPEVLVNELKNRTYNMRKEVKQKGSSFGVKQYKTVPMKKFAVEILPPLTQEELVALAQDQKARHAIDSEV